MHTPRAILRWRIKVSGLQRGVAKRRTQDGEMLPTLAVDWRSSAVRDEEVERFREEADVSIVAASGRSAPR